ncbi:MAG: RodZ domain-containing protein [Bacteroidota bacterium]
MNTVFDILRKAREARHYTLADIADATLINIDHLRALEEGRTDILPEAYIRAFVREYAAAVGLNAQDIMELYNAEQHPEAPTEGRTGPAEKSSSLPEEPAAERRGLMLNSGQYTRTIVVLVSLAICAIVTWNIFGVRGSIDRRDSFRDVLRENEERAGIQTGPDNAPKGMTDSLQRTATNQDSLTLTARTTDSVWVRMMIDDTGPREYLFHPNMKITWRGANQFLFFTIGNAGALQLYLNGRSLGAAGKPGRVVQELVVNRHGIIPPDSLQQSRTDLASP